METRIYLVTHHGAEEAEHFLVRAGSQAQAVRHVAKNRFDCRVAEQDDIVEHVGTGVKVQVASNE
jgi:hypothetical protein